MANAPLPQNQVAAIFGGIIQSLMSGGEQAALTYLVAEVPLFGSPFFNYIAKTLIGMIAGPVQTFLINNATGIVIKIQGNVEQSGIVAASIALKIAQNSGDQAAIEKATQNAIQAFQKVGAWDGAYNAP